MPASSGPPESGLVPLPEFRPSALVQRLDAAGVDFVVIGGIAAVLHGSAQLTQDLDVCYATDPENLDRLGAALTALDARLRGVAEAVPFVPDGRTLRHAQVLTLDTSHGPLDVLAAPSGFPGYDALRERAEEVEFRGIRTRIASLEDLVAMKRAAGRPKDLIAVEELEAIQRILREA
jgi:predicted nucleotidyltransferase